MKMKTILHSDYWAEIPAGDYFAGLSPQQEERIATRMHEQFNAGHYAHWKKRKLEDGSAFIFDQKTVHLDRFYICRFPITEFQLISFSEGQSATSLPGALECPELIETGSGGARYYGRRAVEITTQWAEPLCKELGARLPTGLEWEKAARGSDSRLYPWGNEWNSAAGYFYQGNPEISYYAGGVVNAYPGGVSPYGVWAALGYLPQMVGDFPWPSARGCDPRETSQEMAWIDNIIPLADKRGDYISLRPVLDKWPRHHWRGHKAGNE